MTTTRDMPPLMLRAAFAPSSIDAEKRTAQLTWTTGARVMRGFFEQYWEELSLDPRHVKMDRLRNGAPLLDTHRAGGIADVIGVVESAQLEKTRGTATVRFDRGAAGDEAFRKVSDGIIRNVSVGYRVHKMEKIEDSSDGVPVYRATSWEPHELSMVPIGADADATVRSSDTATNPCHFIEGQRTMSEHKTDHPAATASELGIARAARELERTRATEITKLAKLGKFGDTWATDLIAEGKSVEEARAAALTELARRDDEHVIDGHIRVGSGHDNHAARIGLMSEALASRFGGPKPSADAMQYTRLSTLDFARHLLESRGQSTRMLGKAQIVDLALRSGGYHTSGDFANLLAGAGNRVLSASYEAYQGGLQRACAKTSAQDFRPLQKLRLELGVGPGNATNSVLQKVGEGGEFKRVTANESKEAYSLETFGRIFALSRQAIINDDLGAFGDMSTRLGRAAAEFVAVQLAALLVSNPTLATDSTAVFHANHSNLAGAAAALSVTSLGIALKSMRLQKSLDGVTAIDVTPKFLIVPATQEVLARQVLASITAAQTSNANPFSSMGLDLIVEPRLDASSTTAWYLAADPALVDTIEYAFLDGADGPQLMLQEGWDVDGTEWKVRMDFGAGILDYRGLFKNAGA